MANELIRREQRTRLTGHGSMGRRVKPGEDVLLDLR
jgi:hypothetical protein